MSALRDGLIELDPMGASGGEAISRSRWNDSFRRDSGPSRGHTCMQAFRPIEASKAAIRYVRNA
jgi:hypothetical protein